MKKRLFSLLTAFTIMVPLFAPMTAQAEVTHEHALCQGTECTNPDHASADDHGNITWTAWDTADSLPTGAGNYYLETDVNINSTWEPADGTALCLNGHTITQKKEKVSCIKINSNVTFTLCDCDGIGKITGGNRASRGGGVYIDKLSEFNMYSGNISENSATQYGGGVYIGSSYHGDGHGHIIHESSTFNMYGGKINKNSVIEKTTGSQTYGGGGVYCNGSSLFNMYNGEISENSSSDGGGVCMCSSLTFNMYGGKITGNTAERGGGVRASTCTYNIYNGEITNNTATEAGGGIYNNGHSVDLYGYAVVNNNTVNGEQNNLYLLGKGEEVGIRGALLEGTYIGISIGYDLEDHNTVASGGTTDYSKYFHSDDDRYVIVKSEATNHWPVVDLSLPSAIPHKHNVCSLDDCQEHESITWSVWDKTDSLPDTAGNYYLLNNVNIASRWEPTNNTMLCLNGHSITYTGTSESSVIYVGSGTTFTLCDCAETSGKITGGTFGGVGCDGTFNMFSGEISGNTSSSILSGGGLALSGEFNMFGGKITGNSNTADVALNLIPGGISTGNNSKIKVGGTAYIGENENRESTESNVCMQKAGLISVIETDSHAIKDGAYIGITRGNLEPTAARAEDITEANTSDRSGYFHSDDENYIIVDGQEHIVQLATKEIEITPVIVAPDIITVDIGTSDDEIIETVEKDTSVTGLPGDITDADYTLEYTYDSDENICTIKFVLTPEGEEKYVISDRYEDAACRVEFGKITITPVIQAPDKVSVDRGTSDDEIIEVVKEETSVKGLPNDMTDADYTLEYTYDSSESICTIKFVLTPAGEEKYIISSDYQDETCDVEFGKITITPVIDAPDKVSVDRGTGDDEIIEMIEKDTTVSGLPREMTEADYTLEYTYDSDESICTIKFVLTPAGEEKYIISGDYRDETCQVEIKEPTYTISGTVLDSEDKPIPGAVVSLVKGLTTIIDETITDENGEFSLEDVASGAYNLIVKHNDVTVTSLQRIEENEEGIIIYFPPENVNSMLAIEKDDELIKEIVVGGLDQNATYEAGDAAEKTTLTMTIDRKDDKKLDDEQKAIKEISTNETLEYISIDINLSKGSSETSVKVTREKITIIIPYDTSKKNICVYRYHDGEAEALKEGSGEEYFEIGEGIITICAKKFSTYAIGYGTAVIDEPEEPKPERRSGHSLSNIHRHTVIFDEGEHGTIAEKVVYIADGAAIEQADIPTVAADNGYTFTGWLDKNNKSVDPEGFIVTEPVTFTAAYDKLEEPPIEPREAYIFGYDGDFRPEGNITRAETSAILSRIHKSFDKNTDYGTTFRDVPYEAWYRRYVGFTETEKLMSGYADGSFRPENYITRSEFAAAVAKFANIKETGITAALTDIEGHWAEMYIKACCDSGYITGYSDGSFLPDSYITRAEAVVIINRVLGRQSLENMVNPFRDVDINHWAYAEILKAAY